MTTLNKLKLTCCVFRCTSKKTKNGKFHRLPKPGDGRFMAWIQKLKIPGKLHSKMFVCSKHFKKEDYEGARLKNNAVPSKNLPLVWRNKFHPRDVGRLIKLLELRGIGRLRLCHEGKLSRKLSKIKKKSKVSKVAKNIKKYDQSRVRKDSEMRDEETIEEMLAKMNEDTSETKKKKRLEIVQNHSESELFNADHCFVCDYENCEIHIAQNKEYLCLKCNEDHFKTVKELNEHKLTHGKKIQPFVCMLCEAPFRHKSALMEHVANHALGENSFKCRICKTRFESSQALNEHSRRHQMIRNVYTCRECGVKLKTKLHCWAHLNEHLRSRTKAVHMCDICGRVLSTKATLKEHKLIHSGEKPYECQLCGKKIRHRANFISHVEAHSLGLPHVCRTCGMGFAKKMELNSHVALEHPEDKPFNCIICGMRFRTESRFHKHAVTHDAYLME